LPCPGEKLFTAKDAKGAKEEQKQKPTAECAEKRRDSQEKQKQKNKR